MLAAAVWGQGPDVAIVSAASTTAGTAAPNNNDVKAKLEGTGLFNSVAIVDVAVHAAYTPTLAELQAYDAVITWSNGTYANGQRVYRHTRLQPGDQVVIGSRLFLVECG